MSYLRDFLKYTMIAFVLFAVLYSVPQNTIDSNTIVKLTLLAVIAICIIEKLFFEGFEGMANLKPFRHSSNYVIPLPYNYDTMDEDYILSGLKYDTTIPGYYLINNGHYTEGTVPDNKIKDLINASVWHDLTEQQNYVEVSPHTHVGKARSYIEWQKAV